MNKINQIKPSEIKYKGLSFQITHRLMKVGDKEKVFEEARRAPGTRSIILSEDKSKILLTKEYRHQLDEVDIRLPGGKVFDSLDDYLKFLESKENILLVAEQAAKREVLEETGQIVDEIEFIEKTKCGGMMEWDLYYFVVTKSHASPTGQKLGDGEEITSEWVDVKEVINLCLSGKINEDRSVAVLLQFLHQNGNLGD